MLQMIPGLIGNVIRLTCKVEPGMDPKRVQKCIQNRCQNGFRMISFRDPFGAHFAIHLLSLWDSFDVILRDAFWCQSGIIRCLMGSRSDVLSGYYRSSFWIHFVIIPGSIWYQNWHGNIGSNHFKLHSGINENDCIMDHKRSKEWYQNDPGKVLKVIQK